MKTILIILLVLSKGLLNSIINGKSNSTSIMVIKSLSNNLDLISATVMFSSKQRQNFPNVMFTADLL